MGRKRPEISAIRALTRKRENTLEKISAIRTQSKGDVEGMECLFHGGGGSHDI